MNGIKNLVKIIPNNFKKNFLAISMLAFLLSAFELIFLKIIHSSLNYFTKPTTQDFIIQFLKNYEKKFDISSLVIILIFIIFFIKTFNYIAHLKMSSEFNEKCSANLRYNLFTSYINLPKLFRIRINIEEKIKNLEEEVRNLTSILSSLNTIILETILLVVVSIYLMTVNFKILIILLSLFLILSLLIYYINSKSINNMSGSRIRNLRKRFKLTYDGLSGANIFELTQSRDKLLLNYENTDKIIANLNSRIQFKKGISKSLMELFFAFTIITIIYFNIKEKNSINEIIPILGVFVMAGYRLMPSIVRIISSVQMYNYLIEPFTKIRQDLLFFKKLNIQTKDSIKNFDFKKNIQLKNINFSYNKSKYEENIILKDLNLEILNGDKIGILGESGAGKSTLIDIIMGLVVSNTGQVLIDDYNIKNIKNSWHKNIGCVPQEVFLLDESIKSNVAFGVPKEQIDYDKLKRAIELSKVDDFSKKLKFGIETIIGRNGARLSGGQRQRIGIARAIYNNPKVLVFDEATASLDEVNESLILKDINNNFKDKTVIMITHKKENLKYCNKIFKLENKKIINITQSI